MTPKKSKEVANKLYQLAVGGDTAAIKILFAATGGLENAISLSLADCPQPLETAEMFHSRLKARLVENVQRFFPAADVGAMETMRVLIVDSPESLD